MTIIVVVIVAVVESIVVCNLLLKSTQLLALVQVDQDTMCIKGVPTRPRFLDSTIFREMSYSCIFQ